MWSNIVCFYAFDFLLMLCLSDVLLCLFVIVIVSAYLYVLKHVCLIFTWIYICLIFYSFPDFGRCAFPDSNAHI